MVRNPESLIPDEGPSGPDHEIGVFPGGGPSMHATWCRAPEELRAETAEDGDIKFLGSMLSHAV
jgi:hypothetical protein